MPLNLRFIYTFFLCSNLACFNSESPGDNKKDNAKSQIQQNTLEVKRNASEKNQGIVQINQDVSGIGKGSKKDSSKKEHILPTKTQNSQNNANAKKPENNNESTIQENHFARAGTDINAEDSVDSHIATYEFLKKYNENEAAAFESFCDAVKENPYSTVGEVRALIKEFKPKRNNEEEENVKKFVGSTKLWLNLLEYQLEQEYKDDQLFSIEKLQKSIPLVKMLSNRAITPVLERKWKLINLRRRLDTIT